MVWVIVIFAASVMFVLAIVMSYVLGRAHRAWAVRENPLVERVEAAMAGLNCGQCGHPTCNNYAHAILEKGEPIDKCTPGGAATVRAVAEILGVEPPQVGQHFAVVHCGAHYGDRLGVVAYQGEATCAGANIVAGVQACTYGCLGRSDCERSCPFDAIHVIRGLAVVDYEKCTACGNCVRACPRNIITIEHFKADQVLVVACCNTDPGKETRLACKVGCIACGICQRTCDLFEVKKNLSRIDYVRYDPSRDSAALIEASGKCPTKCLPFRGRPCEDAIAGADEAESKGKTL